MSPVRALAAALLLLAPAPAHALVAARATAPPDSIRFAQLAWRTPAANVSRALAAAGFTAIADRDGEYRGRVHGAEARLTTEFDARGRLLAVMLAFEPDGLGDAVRLYDQLGDELHERLGAWTARIELDRPAPRPLALRFSHVRHAGPPVAATLWAARNGDAAAVQLDGRSRVWVRYESRWWNADAPEREPLP